MKTIFPGAGRDLLIHKLRAVPGFPPSVTVQHLDCAFLDAINDEVDPACITAAAPQLDFPAFARSLLRQGVPERLAHSVGTLAEGIWLEVEFAPRPFLYTPGRREFSVQVQVHGASDDVLEQSAMFRLPRFAINGHVPYQVDSHHAYRAPGQRFPQFRPFTNTPLTARIIDGRWEGGLYVYNVPDREDPTACLARVADGLRDAVLPVLTQGVHCDIYQPDRYAYGVWRVDLHLPPAAIAWTSDQPIAFELPEFERRMVVPDPEHRVALPMRRQLVRQGVWRGELRTNGPVEEDNPESIALVRSRLIEAVYAGLAQHGWHHRSRQVLGLLIRGAA